MPLKLKIKDFYLFKKFIKNVIITYILILKFYEYFIKYSKIAYYKHYSNYIKKN